MGVYMFLGFARATARFLGHPRTFIASVILIVVWALCGPMCNYDADWQLYINTSTTIFTFLTVIILQNSANHDSEELHSKLNEIIALLHMNKLTKAEKRILEDHHMDLIESAIEDAHAENQEAAIENQDIND